MDLAWYRLPFPTLHVPYMQIKDVSQGPFHVCITTYGIKVQVLSLLHCESNAWFEKQWQRFQNTAGTNSENQHLKLLGDE